MELWLCNFIDLHYYLLYVDELFKGKVVWLHRIVLGNLLFSSHRYGSVTCFIAFNLVEMFHCRCPGSFQNIYFCKLWKKLILWLLGYADHDSPMPGLCAPEQCDPKRKVSDLPALGQCVPWVMRPLDMLSLTNVSWHWTAVRYLSK
jgi:hypothetical protein